MKSKLVKQTGASKYFVLCGSEIKHQLFFLSQGSKTIWGESWLECLHRAPESGRVPQGTPEGPRALCSVLGFRSGVGSFLQCFKVFSISGFKHIKQTVRFYNVEELGSSPESLFPGKTLCTVLGCPILTSKQLTEYALNSQMKLAHGVDSWKARFCLEVAGVLNSQMCTESDGCGSRRKLGLLPLPAQPLLLALLAFQERQPPGGWS